MLLAGKHTWADGRVYEGAFKDDKFNGQGEERGGSDRQREQLGKGRRGVGPGRPGSADGWQGCKGFLRETER